MPAKIRAIAAAIVAVALCGAAQAGPKKNPPAWSWCMDKEKASLDEQIRGCTILIESARKKKTIARIYNNRGVAYFRKGQYDLAIADYDQAIGFGYGNALYNRSLAKEKLDDKAGAAADFAAFKSR
jgi:tetratricopeptide (TPR) repeat protein